jgi:hypothetical protein
LAESRDKGDSINGLADQIKLNAWEYKSWLSISYTNDPIPSSRDTEVPRCRLFQIPNTVLAIWAGFGKGVGKKTVDWYAFIESMRRHGLQVVEKDDLTPDSMDAEIRKFTKKKELFGVYLWSHGSEAGVILGGKEYPYAKWDRAERYHLGLGLLFACFSENGRKVFSDQALFWGSHGILSPVTRPIIFDLVGGINLLNNYLPWTTPLTDCAISSCQTFYPDDFPGIDNFLKPLDQ